MALMQRSPLEGNLLGELPFFGNLVPYMTYNDLRNMRATCRSWYIQVSRTKKWRQGIYKVTPGWLERFGTVVNKNICHVWRGAYFKSLNFVNKRIFKEYWALHQDTLRVLKFSKIRVNCLTMINFLNRHPVLEEVYFHRCEFESEEFDHEVQIPQQPALFVGQPVENRVETLKCRTSCTHAGGLEEALGEDPQVPRPTIKSLAWNYQSTFPICVLDLLERRCRGTLERYSFKNPPKVGHRRNRVFPSLPALIEGMNTILLNNRENLQSLEIWKPLKLRDHMHRIFPIDFPQLRECRLGDITLYETTLWEANNTFSNNLTDFFARTRNHLMTSLHVRVSYQWFEPNNLIQVIRTKTQLRDLSIIFPQVGLGEDTVSSVLSSLPHLENFTLQLAHYSTGLNCFRHINLHCPQTKCLNLPYHTSCLEAFRQMRHLRSLTLHKTQRLSDNDFSRLVRGTPHLLEFFMLGCPVTDGGLTGFGQPVLVALQQANFPAEREVIAATARREEGPDVVRLSSWSRLQKLKLQCAVLTDITLCFGISFPDLTDLDMTLCPNITDAGMVAIGLSNPRLERVVILNCRNVSKSGINALITAKPTLVDVHTTKFTLTQVNPRDNLVIHPRFKSVVSIAVKNESCAPPSNER